MNSLRGCRSRVTRLPFAWCTPMQVSRTQTIERIEFMEAKIEGEYLYEGVLFFSFERGCRLLVE